MKTSKKVLADMKEKRTVVSMLNRIDNKHKSIAITEEQYNRFSSIMIHTNSHKVSSVKHSFKSYYNRSYKDRAKRFRLSKAQVKSNIYFKRRKINKVKICYCETEHDIVRLKQLRNKLRQKLINNTQNNRQRIVI